MSTPALNPLVEKIRAKHPGAYDDMDDAALTKAVLRKYPQYSDLAAPAVQKPQSPNMQEVYLDTGEPKKQDVLQKLPQMAYGAVQNAAQVSAPGIAASLVNKFFPNAGPAVQRATGINPTEGATPLKDLGGQIALTGLPLIAGGLDEGGAAGKPAMARPAAAATEEASPGITGRIAEIIKRRAVGKIPGVQLAKDLNYVINGSAESAPTTPNPPAPQVPDWYGKGQYGTPVSQWGQRIPQNTTPPESPKPVEIPPSKVSTTPPESSSKSAILSRLRSIAQQPGTGVSAPPSNGPPLRVAGQAVPADANLTSALQQSLPKSVQSEPPPAYTGNQEFAGKVSKARGMKDYAAKQTESLPPNRVQGKIMQVLRKEGAGSTVGIDRLMEAPQLKGISRQQVIDAAKSLRDQGKIWHEQTGGGAHPVSYTMALKGRS